jgi:hypothetical protein
MGHDRSHTRALARAVLKTNEILRLSSTGLCVAEIATGLSLKAKMVARIIRDSKIEIAETSGGITWSPEQDAIILQMRQREGRLFRSISEKLDIAASDIETRYNYLMNQMQKQKKVATRTVAKCSACKGPFLKEGRFHWLCNPCKAGSSGLPDLYLVEHSPSKTGR